TDAQLQAAQAQLQAAQLQAAQAQLQANQAQTDAQLQAAQAQLQANQAQTDAQLQANQAQLQAAQAQAAAQQQLALVLPTATGQQPPALVPPGPQPAAGQEIAFEVTQIQGESAAPQMAVEQQTPPPTQPPEGSLSRESILRVMLGNRPEFNQCYQQARQTDPSLQGRLALRFFIDPDGQVTSSQITESTIPNAALHQCIMQQVGQLHFPKPDPPGIVTVNYPFVFSAE
ncbi:MAG: energy transducer TonB, partial [Bradymonadales bacterium]|nr:energy transducer TonB [Bradymonadales bacterium]